jgi:hypothetical protein
VQPVAASANAPVIPPNVQADLNEDQLNSAAATVSDVDSSIADETGSYEDEEVPEGQAANIVQDGVIEGAESVSNSLVIQQPVSSATSTVSAATSTIVDNDDDDDDDDDEDVDLDITGDDDDDDDDEDEEEDEGTNEEDDDDDEDDIDGLADIASARRAPRELKGKGKKHRSGASAKSAKSPQKPSAPAVSKPNLQ